MKNRAGAFQKKARTIYSLFHSRAESVNVGLRDRQGKLNSVSQHSIIVCDNRFSNCIRATATEVGAVTKRLARDSILLTATSGGFNIQFTNLKEGVGSESRYEGPRPISKSFTDKTLTVYSDLSDCFFHVYIIPDEGSFVKGYFEFILSFLESAHKGLDDDADGRAKADEDEASKDEDGKV